MLEFNEITDFDKLFIDTKYIFDIIFWVKTEWIKDTIGKSHHLRNVVAVKREHNEEAEPTYFGEFTPLKKTN